MRVTQVLCAAGPVDAVTNQALAWRELFDRWGWGGADFAATLAPDMRRGAIRPLRELQPADGEIVLLHYSGFARDLERVLDGSARTVLISHNVTPPDYFWPYEPVEGVRCTLGREQLAALAARADALAGVSEYNAHELREATRREVGVIPVLFDRTGLGPVRDAASGPPTILFVGRLAPHKRQDLVVRTFGEYRRRRADAELVLIGTPLSPSFGAQLRRLAAEIAPGAVTFETSLSASRLAERYRAADVFLCLSEHEGFCIPLLEAFHFGVPVIARDAGAVREVAGDAGVLLEARDGVPTIAELLDIVVEDHELCTELRARGERRLETYDYERTAERLRRTLAGLGT
jgi:glycosyltransferase involved in cell wall biosynthesis